jgi:uncharacterized SAM-binding protein YcdF (DUF218 family)
MDILAKLVAPAALVLWGLIARVAWTRRAGNRPAFAWATAAALAWFCAATPLGASPLIGLLERWHVASGPCASIPPDSLVIVLAGGIDSEATSPEDTSRLSEATLRRTIAAAMIARRSPSTRFIVTGGGGKTVREADLMRTMMIDLGVDRGTRGRTPSGRRSGSTRWAGATGRDSC